MGDATALSRVGASQTRQIWPAPTIAPPAECAETSGAHLARERTGHPRLRRTFVGSEDHFETSVQIHTPGGNLLSHRCRRPRHGGTSARRAGRSARGARTQHPCSQDAPRSPAPTPRVSAAPPNPERRLYSASSPRPLVTGAHSEPPTVQAAPSPASAAWDGPLPDVPLHPSAARPGSQSPRIPAGTLCSGHAAHGPGTFHLPRQQRGGPAVLSGPAWAVRALLL